MSLSNTPFWVMSLQWPAAIRLLMFVCLSIVCLLFAAHSDWWVSSEKLLLVSYCLFVCLLFVCSLLIMLTDDPQVNSYYQASIVGPILKSTVLICNLLYYNAIYIASIFYTVLYSIVQFSTVVHCNTMHCNYLG